MNLIELLRAKSEKEGEEGKNILLKDHIIEALERLKQLNNFIEVNRSAITNEILKDEKFFTALAIAVILHDLGKITYDFQKRLHNTESEEWSKLKEFLKPSHGVDVRHEILSAIWASIVLSDSNAGEWKEWFSKIRTAILLHHYNEYYIGEKDLMEIVQSYLESVEKYLEFILTKKGDLNKFLNDLLDDVSKKFHSSNPILNGMEIIKNNIRLEGVEELLNKIRDHDDDLSTFAEFYEIDNENPDYNFLVFLGCLRRCDYSASGEVDIEGVKGEVIKLEEIFKNIDEKIKRKIEKEPEWQKQVVEKVEPLKSVVLIAPTGAGKTEFALLWNAKNARKLIYTLPLRVALNDLFWRFKNDYFDKDTVNILHSTAFIEYLEEEQKSKTLDVDKKLTTSKILSSPILLTTPDQVFLTSLNYYGSDKVISVYPLSSIVIDEIQTYDPEMASIIIKTLQIVKELQGVVLVMTATLPPYFEPFLNDLNFEKINTKGVEIKNYNRRRHKIDVIEDYLVMYKKDRDGYYIEVNKEKLKEYIEKYEGQNLFVVLNNVSKAIEVYKKLEKEHHNVFLLHSRLIEKEKSERIRKIKELMKKDQVIVVSTQIIEASVDLDFDAMLTEVSPIDSQVQRWGRVHRNRNYDYSKDRPNIVVFIGQKGENGEPKIDIGTSKIYDKRVVEATIEILEKHKGELLGYEEEQHMIEEVFNQPAKTVDPEISKILTKMSVKNPTLKDLYIAEIKRNLDFLKYFSVEKKNQAQRLFRRIVGVQVVVPEIMKIDGDEVDKVLAKIIEDPSSNKMTWKEIIDKIKENGLNLDGDENKEKWKLKKSLHEYSINVPVFYWEDLERVATHEFKGFYVLKVSGDTAEKLQKYGLEKNAVDEIAKKLEEETEIL